MLQREFGNTGLRVSAIGFGAGHIGRDDQDEAAVFALLNGAASLGITLFDTARSYGRSEDRLGRWLAANPGLRDRLAISTKGGYSAPGHADWTGACVTANVEESLRRLGVDRLDIFHLHSCPAETLRREDVLDAVRCAQQAGKIRVSAYSGENEALEFAIASGVFQSVQCSVNVCDQAVMRRSLPAAGSAGLGVIAKRPLANAFWRFETEPEGNYCQTYWKRAVAMGWQPGRDAPGVAALSWPALAVRFAAFAPGVHSAIVGTSNVDNLCGLLREVEKGPLPTATRDEWRAAFEVHGEGWRGEI